VPSSAIGSILRACPEVFLRMYSEGYLGAYPECTCEHFESLLERVSQAAWECAMESNWEHTMKCICQLAFKCVVCSVMNSM